MAPAHRAVPQGRTLLDRPGSSLDTATVGTARRMAGSRCRTRKTRILSHKVWTLKILLLGDRSHGELQRQDVEQVIATHEELDDLRWADYTHDASGDRCHEVRYLVRPDERRAVATRQDSVGRITGSVADANRQDVELVVSRRIRTRDRPRDEKQSRRRSAVLELTISDVGPVDRVVRSGNDRARIGRRSDRVEYAGSRKVDRDDYERHRAEGKFDVGSGRWSNRGRPDSDCGN